MKKMVDPYFEFFIFILKVEKMSNVPSAAASAKAAAPGSDRCPVSQLSHYFFS